VTRGALEPGRSPASAEQACRDAGEALRQRIWDPLDVASSAPHRVFVVPDGVLQVLDLAALPARGGGYLVEQEPLLHLLSTERDLVPVVDTRPVNRGLLAFGGPAFDASLATVAFATAESRTSRPRAATRGTPFPCAELQDVHFPPLPAAAREADAVLQLWRDASAANTACRTGREATETAFKHLAPGRRVLHLATHGFFLKGTCDAAAADARGLGTLVRKPQAADLAGGSTGTGDGDPMLRAGLALAGANDHAHVAPDADDGILTAEEIASLDLQGVEWAVLSACDTGLGEVQSREGVFGLRRAFQMAGVRTLIMSLWSVRDEFSRRWMTELYAARLEGHLDTAEAVRRASRTVLDERRARGESGHPYYWAGFVAAGDWR
jgi:CHAT domain-containing protein